MSDYGAKVRFVADVIARGIVHMEPEDSSTERAMALVRSETGRMPTDILDLVDNTRGAFLLAGNTRVNTTTATVCAFTLHAVAVSTIQ